MKDLVKICGISVLTVSALLSLAQSATKQDLLDEISRLKAEIAALKHSVNTEVTQDVEVMNALASARAKPLSLTVGTTSGAKNSQVVLPVYFKSGSTPVSGLQFDVVVTTAVTPTGITAGPAVKAASKTVTANIVSTGYRVVIFGLNQNEIPTGGLASIKLTIQSGATSGTRTISVLNIIGSDPSGNNVALSGNAGSLTVK